MALFAAGVGTLVFHLCTRGRMPTFLGSSFAFIAALQAVIGGDKANIPKAMGGIIVAGAFYVLLALLIPAVRQPFHGQAVPSGGSGRGDRHHRPESGQRGHQQHSGQRITHFTPAYYWSWGIALFVCLTAIILSSYGKGW